MRRGMAATECTVYQGALRKLAASWARLWPEGLGLTGKLNALPGLLSRGEYAGFLKEGVIALEVGLRNGRTVSGARTNHCQSTADSVAANGNSTVVGG